MHDEIKAEAYKEFAERLKELSDTVIADLKYYLETNEENGVVYIPKIFVEKTLNNFNELVGEE
jgi:hypothetical protein